MNVEEFLHWGETDLPSVRTSIADMVGLEDDDILLAVGSLAEGMGTRKSDLDVLLITSRPASALPPRDEVIWALGKCVVDIRIFPDNVIESLIHRLDHWSRQPWDVSDTAKFTFDERLLLHRLRHGQLLRSPSATRSDAAFRPSDTALARLKLQVARHAGRTIQIDMVGYDETGDYRTLVFAAQKLLGHAVDALLAGYGRTNPLSKWRSRTLGQLPSGWERELLGRPTGLSAADLFWNLQRTPEYPDRVSSRVYARRIVAFTRAAFLWAECRVTGKRFDGPQGHDWIGTESPMTAPPLPSLEFDVDFSFSGDGMKIARLNEFGTVVNLSAQDAALVFLFDGVTTADEALAHVCGTKCSETAGMIDRVQHAVGNAGLTAST
ncbi:MULTISPECIES: nucleotidyltransferase domain-containing protein [Paraburkholderia]|uniref:Nucleotidyltransferase domain-containing protein n=1 Tax=Paraburkholderia youngii TaxID=2782701 RepID=A0ABX2NYL3_9BURK|nr:nucleotidyltransferase domain-containing protein [Paraburkholderia youngii]NVI09605.1 hypothetical protein [Paraburkholderia youngii]